jgi:hypothetical protein
MLLCLRLRLLLLFCTYYLHAPLQNSLKVSGTEVHFTI